MARLFKPSSRRVPVQREETPKTLTVTDLSYDGRGVARHQGKAVFVAGALPGEVVTVSHYRRHKSFSECVANDILTASVWRQEPFCPHFEGCGGCQLQHLQPDQQILLKQQQVLNLLSRQHAMAPRSLLLPMSSADTGYRSRVRFAVSGEQQLAFRQQGSDQLVAVSQCQVLEPALWPVMEALQQWLLQLPRKSGVTHIECFTGAGTDEGGNQILVVVRHTRPLSASQRQALEQVLPGGDCWFRGEKNGPLTDASERPGQPQLQQTLTLPEGLEPVIIRYGPDNFSQVNRAVNQQMVLQALQWLQLQAGDRAMDLFCGVGNFALPMARQAGKVLAVEAVDAMVEAGRQNGALNCIDSVHFLALDLESQALKGLIRQEKINKVLLDPPRAGARFVCEQLAATAIERLVYVSCNPASFARDAAILAAGGFELDSLRVLDMFPHTSHVETMALFVRGGVAASVG
ncbi:TRAM domain-containing protein [Pseudomaricurvus sp. HS19]|uniref:TRAM domain-containing protein n=1 Tax=Pseudomaricurvus sp. HS19 TaxID=2692626 RepID=UPI0013692EB2|nr:TRAM domain-containing protein [Pseudomaricurvus sp. HS19]MYM62568.1 23S rRNA (uracil(1939)-C(5))-methyltransferase RlmD [Pseudomaricurvus sp. HS19]